MYCVIQKRLLASSHSIYPLPLRLATLALVFWLSAFANLPAHAQERDRFPGGLPSYDYGVSQSKENFANIVRAQSNYALYPKHRWWVDVRPGAGASIIGLQAYSRLHARWQLRDGRQFIAENIDVRTIMQAYFKDHDIRMPWQREGRPRAKSGDLGPTLVYEIKDDNVILKWRITTNHTPVNERFTPSGRATMWHLTNEEFFVAAVKGTPTSGINFDQRYETITTGRTQQQDLVSLMR